MKTSAVINTEIFPEGSTDAQADVQNDVKDEKTIKCPHCQKEYKLKLNGDPSQTYMKHVERCKTYAEQYDNLHAKLIDNVGPTPSETKYDRINLNCINKIVEGLNGIIKDKDLHYIIPALNAIAKFSFVTLENFNQIYDKVQKMVNMKADAFNELRKKLKDDATFVGNLVEYVRMNNPQFYTDEYIPVAHRAHYYLDELQNVRMEYKTPITFECFRQTYRYENRNVFKVLNDLKQLIAVKEGSVDFCLIKQYDDKGNVIFRPSNISELKKLLKTYPLWKKIIGDKKEITVTLKDIFNEYIELFEYKAFRFYSTDPKVFSYFVGYGYPTVQEVDGELIAPFLSHIRHVICNDNADLEMYVTNWVSFVLQNPGKKTGTALVIVGQHGTGKNLFTSTICKLIPEYSDPNILKIEDLTGKFNSTVENKMLLVLNEVQNFGEGKYANFDTLKSIITETDIRVEEKYVAKRATEQVVNLILLSNNSLPVYVEETDRRYCFIETNAEFAEQNVKDDESKEEIAQEYFRELVQLKDNPVFLSNLLTYFLQYDVSHFDLRNIPETETRKSAIAVNRSPVTNFIIENFPDFAKGIHTSDADLNFRLFFESNYPNQKFGSKTYWAEINQYCSKVKGKQKNGDEYIGEGPNDFRNFYILKQSWVNHFRKIYDEHKEF